MIPAPEIGPGWTTEVVRRPSGRKDRYFLSPSGKKLRSSKEVERYLEKLGGGAQPQPDLSSPCSDDPAETSVADYGTIEVEAVTSIGAQPQPDLSSPSDDPAETSVADYGTVEVEAVTSMLLLGKMVTGGCTPKSGATAPTPPLNSPGEMGEDRWVAAAEDDEGRAGELSGPEHLGGERTPAPHIGPGWTVEVAVRRCGRRDTYFFSPGGRRLRSRAEVERHLSRSASVSADESSDIGSHRDDETARSAGTVPADGKTGGRSSKRAGRLSEKARQARIPGIPGSRDAGAPAAHALAVNRQGGSTLGKRNEKRQKQASSGRSGIKGCAAHEGGKPCIPEGGARLVGRNRSNKSTVSSHCDMATLATASEKVHPLLIGGGSTDQIVHTMDKAPRKRVSKMNWDQHIKDLEEYRRAHGHCNVNQRKDKRSLAVFVKNIRHYKKRIDAGEEIRVLTSDRIQQLDSMGFQWVRQQAGKRRGFDDYLKDLQEFKAWHGHCDVPPWYEENKTLAQWCRAMRRSYRRYQRGEKPAYKYLDDSAISTLEGMGFRWKVLESDMRAVRLKSFEERVEDLEEHSRRHGTLLATEASDPSLARFCVAMRRARMRPDQPNLMKMSDERIRRLDELGFDWHLPADGGSPRVGRASRASPTDRPIGSRTFAEWIEELKAHKDKHGHLRVLERVNGPLFQFCRRVRHARRNPERSRIELSDDRVALLDALGFDWARKKRTTSFPARVASLRAYKEKHGHVRVRKDEDKGLYDFCCHIRSARKYGKASEEHVSLLDALGFNWKVVKKMKFEESLEALRSYKEKHGHMNVSRAEDRSLYDFCFNMRKARQNMGKSGSINMTEERIASLDSIGFNWKHCDQEGSRAKLFADRIAALKSYKEEHGHLNIRRDEDPSLYKFSQHMRWSRSSAKGKIKLSDERIALLDDIGFDWIPIRSTISGREKRMKQRENNVLVGLEALKVYKVKHGHLNVSRTEDQRLAAFCWGMRFSRRKSCDKVLSLPEPAVQQLTKLGFNWDRVDRGLSRTADLPHSGSAGTPKKDVTRMIDGKISTCIPEGGAWLMGSNRSGEMIASRNGDAAISATDSEKARPPQIGRGSTEQIAHTINKAPSKRKMDWDKHIKDLEEYRRAHGHCSVNQRNDNRSLAMFVKNIRHYKKRLDAGAKIGVLTQDRIEQLDSMGFQWVGLHAWKTKRSVSGSEEKRRREREGNFLVGLEALKAYKEKNGHLNVSKSEDRCLAAFCWGLRYSRRKSCSKVFSLSESVVQQLTELGFDWDCVDRGPTLSADSSHSCSVGTPKKTTTCKTDGKRSFLKKIEEPTEGEREGKAKDKHMRTVGKEIEHLQSSCENMRDALLNPATKPMLSEDQPAPLDPVSLNCGQPSAACTLKFLETAEVVSVAALDSKLRPFHRREGLPRPNPKEGSPCTRPRPEDGTIFMPIGCDAAAAGGPIAAWRSLSYKAFPVNQLNKGGRIGVYPPAERRARIAKFRSKRGARIWRRRRVQYECRKTFADSRLRIKGQFAKRSKVEGCAIDVDKEKSVCAARPMPGGGHCK